MFGAPATPFPSKTTVGNTMPSGQPAAAQSAIELDGVSKKFGAGESSLHAVRNLNLKIQKGEFFTFLGPSGCGKTTTLRMIAGFEQPSEGSILLDGLEVSGKPAHRRNINTVFQSYALFPHLSVADNVGFGLSVKRVPKAERVDRVKAALDAVQMGHAGDRKPSALSGGQQQRVALARALVNRPSVLLLDEPFGALDLKLRRQMQLEVKQMQQRLGITFIFVTHDQEEALTMSDRIAVMNGGMLSQVDSPVGIYENPADCFTASFIGEMNLIQTTSTLSETGEAVVHLGDSVLDCPSGCGQIHPGSKVTIAFRPEALSIGPVLADQINFTARITESVFVGTDTLVGARTANGENLQLRLRNGPERVALPSIGETVPIRCPRGAVHILQR